MAKRTDLFIGAKLNEDNEQQNHDKDFYKPYMNGKNEIICIFAHDYIFLGEIIHKKVIGVIQVDTFEFSNKKIEIRSKLYKEFNRFLNVGIWIITE